MSHTHLTRFVALREKHQGHHQHTDTRKDEEGVDVAECLRLRQQGLVNKSVSLLVCIAAAEAVFPRVEIDAEGNALHYFNKVSGRVLERQKAVFLAACGGSAMVARLTLAQAAIDY